MGVKNLSSRLACFPWWPYQVKTLAVGCLALKISVIPNFEVEILSSSEPMRLAVESECEWLSRSLDVMQFVSPARMFFLVKDRNSGRHWL
ncbi:hypothetical protein EB796_012264 [Bugula neritina]|uniref:Uncharacterized protein n=1 Tax=Bugula neritina TaxID=10212 RepID=A0A7J7JVQ8_BUGNE|nr:hypothetical protein EB796_012264 [Bugula neritina]